MSDCIYNQLSDEQLSSMASAGDSGAEEELVLRYFKTVRAFARPYFLEGGDMEDLIQEGMIGLIQAIRKYRTESGTPFGSFARTCVKNRIYTAIRSAVRDKHVPLNRSVSLDDAEESDPALTLLNYINPEDAVIDNEKTGEILEDMGKKLSQFELKVAVLYLQGLSYEEIAETLEKSRKSVDNAVQRIRKKFTVA